MTTKLRQPIKRHGGKNYLAKWVISLMPPRCKNPNKPAADDPGWLHYVEPYFGGGSVLLAMDPEGISEVVNDLDGELTNFWSVIQQQHAFEKFMRRIQTTPVSEAEYQRAKHPLRLQDVDAGSAADFFIRNRQSRQALEKDFATVTRNRTRCGMNEQVSAWLSAIDGLPEIHKRMKRVLILNRPAIKVIQQQDGPRTLHYLDPPYLHETRSSTGEYGECEMSYQHHAELLQQLGDIRGRFLLSGYHSELYDGWATHYGWHCHEMPIDNKASSAKEKETRIECVWANY